MRKKLGISFIVSGAVLLLAALSLLLYNRLEDNRSGNAAQTVLSGLSELIPDEKEEAGGVNPNSPSVTPGGILSEYEDELQQETTVEYDGVRYLGVISIPSLGVEVPVTADYELSYMKFASCRYSGTVYDGDMILCAHNYRTHFGKIGDLYSGDEIIFTDADGKRHTYEVLGTTTIDGYDVEQMKSGSEEWDLTLFTCTLARVDRVTVRAVLVE